MINKQKDGIKNKMENEMKQGHCDICGEQKTDTAENLKSEGWYLGSREHFCPNCND